MKKEIALLSVIITVIAIVFGWYLFIVNPRNTTADIYLDNCLQASLKDSVNVEGIFVSCELASDFYREHGEWDLLFPN
jgi:hypothetical protein